MDRHVMAFVAIALALVTWKKQGSKIQQAETESVESGHLHKPREVFL
jgi:hypothetical protein